VLVHDVLHPGHRVRRLDRGVVERPVLAQHRRPGQSSRRSSRKPYSYISPITVHID
jgi:hypothetical protein